MMCKKTWRGKNICMTLPITHRNNEDNKGVIGTFTDETASLVISEFVGLRSKMYSYVCPAPKSNPEHKVAKGVQKYSIANNLIFENY